MKLRLTQSGFENYSGQMGVIFFEDGLSKGDVLLQDAIRMSAVMLCEWEDGTTVSIAQSILDNANTPAPTFVSGEEGQHDLDAVKTPDVDKVAAVTFTEAELHEIADKDGIRGLRNIAEPFGIKANSIKDLIEALLKVGTTV